MDGSRNLQNSTSKNSAVHGLVTAVDSVSRTDDVALEERNSPQGSSGQEYRVYRRRFFGLTQLILLNIIVSWDWLTFSALSTTSAEYFDVSETAINWLSTGFLFAFVIVSPVVIWTLNRGPKEAIIVSSILILIGNWIRYAGARATGGHFGVVMFGQILIGFAQPFVLSAPTRYSDLWFSDKGRISATAVVSLSNPFGGALAQLIDPLWASKASDIPNMILWVSIMSSIACIPSFFVPAAPPTPPSASSTVPKISLQKSFHLLLHSPFFWLGFAPFSIYVGFFNSISSLINQILGPYGYSEDEAGICGAVLILVGLVAAAVISPLTDRTKAYLLTIKILIPILALSYLAFIWMPQTRTIAGPYVVAAVLGASSFALVPIVLEFLVEVTFPASPEVGSTVFWAGGQLLGGIFIIIMGALKDETATGGDTVHHGDRPKNNMYRALVFEAVLCLAVVPLPLLMGIDKLGLGGAKESRRLGLDRQADQQRSVDP
ncbi:MFS general substrate transporter [Rhizodiscina lignyota]|uniref:MFS general substrate transporter n=1 Tax=Rhizodiscina lignyota TaxID=1504668 RepID=A0A9P4IU79_9PEZI|nr:MFS general substrate transporter [Rhizodiscina lignyota]